MKTISFIGSDKNAGKTTAMNVVARKLDSLVCFSSIGLNGEKIDNLSGTEKPMVEIKANNYFLTASKHLKKNSGRYKTIQILTPPSFSKYYVLGQALQDMTLTLEGPNDKDGWILAKKLLNKVIPKGTLLIDGSIDRQFIGHPEISDSFYFSLLLTGRKDQQDKAKSLLSPLLLQECDTKYKKVLNKINAKSILFDKNLNPTYIGMEIPFLDLNLLRNIKKDEVQTLYLDGSLTTKFADTLSQYRNLAVILHNFTLLQSSRSCNDISLLYPLKLESIFIKEEEFVELELPRDIGVINIFRDNIDAIAI